LKPFDAGVERRYPAPGVPKETDPSRADPRVLCEQFQRAVEGRDGGKFDTRHRIAVKVSGDDTGGAMAVLEVRTAVDAGPSLHVHHVENEWFYALEGEYDIQVGK
jgi:mannose-6-phosphate isomerase-like protein (cupin superfamily)